MSCVSGALRGGVWASLRFWNVCRVLSQVTSSVLTELSRRWCAGARSWRHPCEWQLSHHGRDSDGRDLRWGGPRGARGGGGRRQAPEPVSGSPAGRWLTAGARSPPQAHQSSVSLPQDVRRQNPLGRRLPSRSLAEHSQAQSVRSCDLSPQGLHLDWDRW